MVRYSDYLQGSEKTLLSIHNMYIVNIIVILSKVKEENFFPNDYDKTRTPISPTTNVKPVMTILFPEPPLPGI